MFVLMFYIFLIFTVVASVFQYESGLTYSIKKGNNIKGAIARSFLLIFLVNWNVLFFGGNGGHGGALPVPMPAPIIVVFLMDSISKLMFSFLLFLSFIPTIPYFIAYFGNRNNPAWCCLSCRQVNKTSNSKCKGCILSISDTAKQVNWLCPECNVANSEKNNSCSACGKEFFKD